MHVAGSSMLTSALFAHLRIQTEVLPLGTNDFYSLSSVGLTIAVDFDGNEILIEDGGNAGIGIRLFLHDVAPMTGKVADGEKDRFVLLAVFFEAFVAPRIPIHWIVGMQEKIRTLRTNEPVHVGVLSCSRTRLGGLIVFGFRGCVGGRKSLSGSFHRAH